VLDLVIVELIPVVLLGYRANLWQDGSWIGQRPGPDKKFIGWEPGTSTGQRSTRCTRRVAIGPNHYSFKQWQRTRNFNTVLIKRKNQTMKPLFPLLLGIYIEIDDLLHHWRKDKFEAALKSQSVNYSNLNKNSSL
jgi:hypothetical protein